MKSTYYPSLLLLWTLGLPVQAADCSTAFVCQIVNYQRMYLDGRVQKLTGEPFGFRLQGKELVPQMGGSPLGDGTLNYEIHDPRLCDADGRLDTNVFNDDYQFEGRSSLYSFEFLNGKLLISAHKHHDYFDLTSSVCREL